MRPKFRAVIITGASSGLGAALAEAYAGPETKLGLLGRDRERLAASADACEAKGASVRMGAIDVADAPAMASWLAGFDRDHPVELLVANAGTSAGPDFDSPSEGTESAARQVRVNLLGAINTVEPLLPGLCARGRGRIALVASIAAYRGLPYSPGYCASKAGLRAYAEALRPRLAPRGIGVTSRVPGFFQFADDRSVGRADPVSARGRQRRADRQARHRSRAAGGSPFHGRWCSVCSSATSPRPSSATRSCAASASRSAQVRMRRG